MEKHKQIPYIRSLVMIYIVLEGVGVVNTKPNEYYCSMNPAHTMCSYTKFDSMELHCHDYDPVSPPVLEPIILDKHNSLRNDYANHGGGNFTVPNMLALEWDTELADIAARWAWQCPYYEDDFRDVDRFKVANLVGVLAEVHDFPELDEVWRSLTIGNHTFHRMPRQNGRRDILKRLDEPLSILTDPYFKHVGCAAARYMQVIDDVDERRTILVCNYGPLDSPYSPKQPAGPPCSRCPSGTSCDSSSTYRSLCVVNLSTHKHRKSGNRKANREIEGVEDPKQYEGESGEGDGFDDERQSLDVNFTQKYCDIMCDNGNKHTLCEYQGPTTEYDEVIPVMGDDMHAMILNVHNIIRDNFAAGNWDDSTYETTGEKSTGLPLAANMREMQWNDELAMIALMWTMQCQPRNDDCRDTFLEEGTDVPSYVSQLIDATNWSGKNEFPSPETSFFKWYNVFIHFTADEIGPFRTPRDPSKDYSSFAQIIWADTYLIGCAMSLCRQRNSSQSLIVTACNYGPGGMIEGHNVYIKGGPCTHCRRLNTSSLGGMYCSGEYHHLCSGMLNLMKEKFDQPCQHGMCVSMGR